MCAVDRPSNLYSVLYGAVSARNRRREKTMGRLEALCSRICDTHHVYLREHLPRLAALIVRENGKIEPPARGAMKTIAECFRARRGESTAHLMKEAQILFPTILSIQRALAGARTAGGARHRGAP